ncbi:hypothetical protein J6Q66_07610 [bacterium]|nr:hypothetical protein [bacterium]
MKFLVFLFFLIIFYIFKAIANLGQGTIEIAKSAYAAVNEKPIRNYNLHNKSANDITDIFLTIIKKNDEILKQFLSQKTEFSNDNVAKGCIYITLYAIYMCYAAANFSIMPKDIIHTYFVGCHIEIFKNFNELMNEKLIFEIEEFEEILLQRSLYFTNILKNLDMEKDPIISSYQTIKCINDCIGNDINGIKTNNKFPKNIVTPEFCEEYITLDDWYYLSGLFLKKAEQDAKIFSNCKFNY